MHFAVLVLHIFFFNDPATTEIYPLSPPDALPISAQIDRLAGRQRFAGDDRFDIAKDHLRLPCRRSTHTIMVFLARRGRDRIDRKSTRLNSSHANISYAVFCLKKKKTKLSRSR